MYNTIFWSWNDKIDTSMFDAQLSEMKEQGIDGCFIHARSGLEIEYMGEDWMAAIEKSVFSATKYGIDIWLYDEYGWPSGDAAGKVQTLGREYLGKFLRFSTSLNDEVRDGFIAAYRKNGSEYILCDENDAADLYAYYIVNDSVDRMYEDSGNAFVRFTHEKYRARLGKYFGKGIKGIFFDEPQISFKWPEVDDLAWSDSLLDGYKALFDKDLREDLWELSCLRRPSKLLYGYLTACGKLFRENFMLPMQKWCHENSMSLIGHFCMEESLSTSLRLCGSVMRNYAELDIPGIDFLGNRSPSPLLGKQLGSIANQFDKKAIMCEAFGAAGWSATTGDYLRIWRQLAVRGVNMPCLHLYANSIEGDRKFDYPAFFSPQSIWFDKCDALLNEIKSIDSFISNGKEKNDVLVLSPMYATAAYGLEDIENRKTATSYRNLLELLDEIQILYDIGDEDILAEYGSVEGSRLYINDCVYALIVLPEMKNIKSTTLNLLSEYVKNGGKLFFVGEYPEYVDFEKDDKLNSFLHLFETLPYGNRTVCKRHPLKKAFVGVDYYRKAYVTDFVSSDYSKDILLRITETENERFVMLVNQSNASDFDGYLHVNGKNSVKSLNLLNGSVKRMRVITNEQESLVRLKIPKTGAEYLIITPEEKTDNRLQPEERESTIRFLPIKAVKLLDKNILALDSVQVLETEKQWSKVQFVDCLTLNDEVRTVKYRFFVEEYFSEVALLLETRGVEEVRVNHHKLDLIGARSRIDSGMKEIDITSYMCEYENEIELKYLVGNDLLGNRAQTLYLQGNFDVASCLKGETQNCFVTDGSYKMVHRRDFYDPALCLTPQGAWFYRGKAEYSFDYEYHGGVVEVSFGTVYGAVADIVVNGEYAFTVTDFFRTYCIPKESLREKNRIQVILYSTDRNFFGPFHRKDGESDMVSKEVFCGALGFGDINCYGYSDYEQQVFDKDYHLGKFGLLEGIFIVEK